MLSKRQLILERQWLHLLLLATLMAAIVLLSRLNHFYDGELFGICTINWFLLAVILPIAHQVHVLIWWRMELHLALMSHLFGRLAFMIYAILFSILGSARVLAVILLAYANRDSLTFYPLLLKLLAVIVAIPAVYLGYSVTRYFGFRRAFGIDHFDKDYRTKPFVKQGIFRFTNNGMYTFGFLILWVPGLWYSSVAALAVACFQHLYIWVHYFVTEKPDIARMYDAK